jgi:YD repeat-containing protein
VPTSAAHTISYAYDLYDRLTTTTYADGSTETLTLDHDGQVTQRVNRGGLTTTYTYDAMGRVTNETDQSFSAPFTYTYDRVGRPLTVTYSAGTFTYGYDTAGRQSQTTRPDGLATGYQYDNDGNTAVITYPDGYYYIYAFDELDRMTGVQESTPGANGTRTTLVTYGYDQLSRRTANTFGNGTSTSFSYDAYSGIATLAHSFVGAAPPPTMASASPTRATTWSAAPTMPSRSAPMSGIHRLRAPPATRRTPATSTPASTARRWPMTATATSTPTPRPHSAVRPTASTRKTG